MTTVVAAAAGVISVVVLACGNSQERSDFPGYDDASSPAVADASTDPSPGVFAEAGDAGGPTQIPVRKIPGLTSITYYETSGTVNSYEFKVDGPEMTTKIPALSETAHDIKGVDTEFYDVYYSDDKGVFDIDGAYLTIAGVFGYTLPAGGGLNLAEISLNYSAGKTEFGNYVASYVALGDNAAPASAALAIDGRLDTCSTMGNTVADPTKLLRITLGFAASSGAPR